MVVQGQRAVAARYRALQFVPYLEAVGWHVEVGVQGASLAERVALVRRARRADVVFVQKKRLAGWQLRAIRQSGARIVYDVDDAVLYRSSRHARRRSRTRERRFARTLRHADLVVAGNPHLAELVRRRGAEAVVLPLSFALERYARRPRVARPREELVLGWIGGGKSLAFLRPLAPTLERLGARHPELRLRVVCDRPFELERLPVESVAWSEASEGASVASFDIGLAPLPEDAWARGKSGTKLLQYFCAGVAAVASPVGVHCELAGGGSRALLATSHEEWEQALTRLIQEPELRLRLGSAAREYARTHHAVAPNAARLATWLHALAQA